MTVKRAWSTVAVGVLASQAGHLLAYQVRFGAMARQVQSAGAHAYFPVLAKTTLGAMAAAFVTGIFVIGLARVLAGRSRLRTSFSGSSYIGVLSALFTVQLGCFIVQEVAETMVAGLAVDSAPRLLLWGTLGQLPVAALAALALGWLWTRFEAAVDDLRVVLATAHLRWPEVAAVIALRPALDRALLLSTVAGSSVGKRGPPPSSRFSR